MLEVKETGMKVQGRTVNRWNVEICSH